MSKGLSGWISGKFRVHVSMLSIIHAIRTWIRVCSKWKIVRNTFHALKDALKWKTNGAKAQSPRLFYVFIYEDLTLCIFLNLKFRKKFKQCIWNPQIKISYFFITLKILLHFCERKPIPFQVRASLTSDLVFKKLLL